MNRIQRIGPHNVFTEIDDDGNLLDHWKIINKLIAVECLGSDGEIHYLQGYLGLDISDDLVESAFNSMERRLINEMSAKGVWIDEA
jgi:hypothetical protein